MSYRHLPRTLPRSPLLPRPTTYRSYATVREDFSLSRLAPPPTGRKPRIPKAPRRLPEDPARNRNPNERPPTSRFPLVLAGATFLYFGGTVAWKNYERMSKPRKPRDSDSDDSDGMGLKRSLHYADAPLPSQHLPSVVVVEKDPKGAEGDVDLVPSGTSSVPPFPRTLKLEDGVYHLLGLGIRTVSFLNIQVYVGGLYVHEHDLAGLQMAVLKHVVGEHATAATVTERNEMRRVLMDGGEQGERVWRELLMDLDNAGWRSAWRIVPTRNTDFGHLRDGWVRGIQARTKNASPASPTTAATTALTTTTSAASALTFDDEGFQEAMRNFKAVVGGKRSVPKQKTLLLHRDARGVLSVYFDPSGKNNGTLGPNTVSMGKVQDPRISALLWLNYLAGEKVASKGARESVVNGVVGMSERPAGVQVGA